MTLFLQELLSAVALASVYILVAFGITLLFGLLRLVNFTQGVIAGLGAFATYEFARLGFPLAAALVLSSLVVGIASTGLLFHLFRSTLASPFSGFVISLGLIIAIPPAYALIWPNATYSIRTSFSDAWGFHGLYFDKRKVALIAVAIVVTVALVLILKRTQFGRGVRAASDNLTAARVLGVPVFTLIGVTFVVGCSLAALGGGFLGFTYSFNAYSGDAFLLTGFAVAVVGGLGSLGGSALAALILALSETYLGAYISERWADSLGLAAIVVVLVLRPRGLFGKAGVAPHLDTAAAARSTAMPGAARGPRSRAAMSIQWATRVACAGVLIAVPWLLPTQRLLSDAVYATVLIIGAYGVWYLFHYGGVLSIAQAGFIGIGAYTTGLAIAHWGLSFWLQILLAVTVSSAVALIAGLLALRARGMYMMMIIFALNQLLVEALTNWSSLTGGELGLLNLVPARPFGTLGDFRKLDQLYWLGLGFAAVAIGIVYILGKSSFSHRLMAVRDDELLARSLGLNTFSHQVMGWVIAAAFGGLAGVMLMYQQGAVAPEMFGIWPGAVFILIVLLGGSGFFWGPMIGAAIYIFLPEILGLGPGTTQLAEGLLLVAVIIAMPRGVGGVIQMVTRRIASATRTELFGGSDAVDLTP